MRAEKGRDWTVYLGDCLEILPTLEDDSVSAIITDPPYGIDYQSAWRIDKTTWKPKLAGDDKPCIEWIPLSVHTLTDISCCLCFCRWDVEQVFRDALSINRLIVRSQVIWDRMVHGMGNLEGAFAPQHDNIIFATKGHFAFPGKRPYSVIRVARIAAESLVHPTEKPVPLLSYLIRHVTKIDDIVLDPFMGSGSTGCACLLADRRFIGIEVNEDYFHVAVKRLQEAEMQLRLPGV